jgi:tRNA(Arg) A34 adenosine deaminase TadA
MTDTLLRRPAPAVLSRRMALGSVALGAGAGLTAVLPPHANAAMPIAQPPSATPQAFMDRAFAMRQQAQDAGDQPYGAVVVRDGLIVGEAPSRVVTTRDPTAHAEGEAIRDAARRLGTRWLAGCTMYSSSRPCPMCQAAGYWAGLARLYHGAAGEDGGPPRLPGC